MFVMSSFGRIPLDGRLACDFQAARLHSSYATDGEISEEGFVQIIMKAGVVALGKPVPAAFLVRVFPGVTVAVRCHCHPRFPV
jgi:hypothetical protein